MGAPTSTYNSAADLALGSVPQVEDEALYRELLDVHNAIEGLVTHSDDISTIFAAYIDKQRNNTPISSDYTVLITDGTVEVDASLGDVIVTLPPAASGPGFRYAIKRVDLVPANKVTLIGDGAELIDDRPSGIRVSTKSSYTVKANSTSTGYNII